MANDTLPTAPAAQPESAWQRAERILSGDIRPDDYLPVTPEVRRLTDREMAYAHERLKGVEPHPAVETRQLKQNLLLVHCPEQHVAVIEDDTGVIVVITGLDETAELIRRFPYEQRKHVSYGYVNLIW